MVKSKFLKSVRDFGNIKAEILIATISMGVLLSFQINSPTDAQREISYTGRVLSDKINQEKMMVNHLKKEIKKVEDEKQKLESDRAGESVKYQELRSELNKLKLLAGEHDVQGEGVVIRIDSGSDSNIAYTMDGKKLMIMLINELRDQGAELFSINDQRLTNQSGITLAGSHLDINNTEIAPMYEIKVIGNSEQMYHYIKQESVTVRFMEKVYQFNISVKQSDRVLINANPYVKNIEHLERPLH